MRTLAVLALALVVACPARETGPSADLDTTGVVRGVVRWNGARHFRGCPNSLPPPYDAWWPGGSPPDPRFEVADDGGLPHVFVWAAQGPHRERKWFAPATPVELAASRAMYVPHVLGVMAGQPLRFSTWDANLPHCFRGRPVVNPAFKLRATPDEPATCTLTRKEKAIRITSDVLTWMSAFVFVLDHPFFATTDASGRFEIRGLPPGDYVFQVWHEGMTADARSHEAETKVTLASGAAADVIVELR